MGVQAARSSRAMCATWTERERTSDGETRLTDASRTTAR
ncbi:hypothetical protein ZOD2009_15136 [Haladaptatus paucihalophilus DX253]|uniref:Uncharacterized protein n=1 Tax=Haladaptatus paucihalophilus DX253 TaxID=797209 RepID=E7QW39_HALPU|nr:hypothetical protein ZOD2009_15136 [Haladaptatus paucihalophilus DX253]